MDKRFFVFIALSMLLLMANSAVMNRLNPPPQPAARGVWGRVADQLLADARRAAKEKAPKKKLVAAAAGGAEQGQDEPLLADDPPAEVKRWVLGTDSSAITAVLLNRGAAVEWVGLNDPRYLDLDGLLNDQGFVGYLALSDSPDGVRVGVVAPGTPAHGKLLPGDVIRSVKIGDKEETSFKARHLRRWINSRPVGAKLTFSIERNGARLDAVEIETVKRPLELIRPERFDAATGQPELANPLDERADPLSMLMTFAQIDEEHLPNDLAGAFGAKLDAVDGGVMVRGLTDGGAAQRAGLKERDVIQFVDGRPIETTTEIIRPNTPAGARLRIKYLRDGQSLETDVQLPQEIKGVDLRSGNWEIVKDKSDETTAVFSKHLPQFGLTVFKTFRLDVEKFQLSLEIGIANDEDRPRKLVYSLDGFNGLPTEGWWYARKIARNWTGGAGVRDVVYQLGGKTDMVSATTIAQDGAELKPTTIEGETQRLSFIAVDAQYFAAALIPQVGEEQAQWLADVLPMRVGPVPEGKRAQLTNTTFRVTTHVVELGAKGQEQATASHAYTLFLGPKKPDVLAGYGLSELVYYGWPIFAWVAGLMVWVLNLFHGLVANYAIAIIMLTMVVRGLMFPLSRKQALGAQKMQELQPEMRRIAEKFKKKPEERIKAQRELFAKHNYNPFGGCLLLFVQLPIFIGLYKGLSASVELRQTPLAEWIPWCTNLAAPDMLFRWESWMPAFLGSETGWLGPYFNLLPVITIVLFIVQQKMFMPPPTDEQSAMQQKMMKYMMIFFGFLFFCVPAGLCIYFIASSLWGIAERKLLGKTTGGDASKQTAQPKTTQPERKSSAPPKDAGERSTYPGASKSTNGANIKNSANPSKGGNGADQRRRRRKKGKKRGGGSR